MPKEKSQIDILLPDTIPYITPRTNHKVTFREFKFKETKEILKLIGKYYALITNPIDENIRIFITALNEEVAQDFSFLIKICTGVSDEILDDLYTSEIVKLFIQCVEVNRNFLKDQFEGLIPKAEEVLETETPQETVTTGA